ncbi:hypothetical protein ABEG63_01520 [Chryseobacterium sp. C39-AII1]|uniref:hypothetical protein n=1 Tax=Chryseobacterium sp. C39-AII1 TaxID=3080332 RepID=UPI00320B3812
MYALIFTLFILIVLYVRKKENPNFSFKNLLFFGLIVWIISLFFFWLSGLVGSSVYASLFEKNYEAKVISHQTLNDTKKAVVEFKNDQNKTLVLPLNYGSSDPIAIGTILKVSYKNGDQQVKNLSFWEDKTTTFIVLIFFIIFSFAILGITLYAFGRDISFIWKIVIGFVMYILFPAAMLGFIVAMSWVIWEYFDGKRDDTPIWVLGVCSLFVTILIPALIGYIKMLFEKNDIKIEENSNSKRIKARLSKFNKRIPK